MNRLDDLTELPEFDDLRDVFERAMDGITVPEQRLQSGGLRAGRRLRLRIRRRRAAAATAGIAAAAVVGALLAPGLGGTGRTASDPQPAASLTPSTPAFVDRPGWWDMPARQMRQRVDALLPDGVTVISYAKRNTDHAPGESDEMIGVLSAIVNAPKGPGSLEVMLIQAPDADPIFTTPADPSALDGVDLTSSDFSCSPDDFSVEPTLCEPLDDAQGRPYGVVSEVTEDGVTTRSVKLRTHDGVVLASVANSLQRKWTAPASADAPPLTLDELRALAETSAWTDWTPPAG